MPNFILPGRFQPPHNDHVRIIRAALARTTSDLFIGLIVHAEPTGSAGTPFEEEARKQNAFDRNPFSFSQRLQLLNAVLGAHVSPAERVRTVHHPSVVTRPRI